MGTKTITKTITKKVTTCSDCPYFYGTPDGPSCEAIEKIVRKRDWSMALIYPEGRHAIHPRCPF